MHSMSREFYDFIAKKINAYFQGLDAQNSLQSAESFCLKLDDTNMVAEVSNSLHNLAEENHCLGKYTIPCSDGERYETFTLKLKNEEVIIGAQINGITNDFLCATLRNVANKEKKPLLLISANPIDSAKSGSRDLASNGMPFYADKLIIEIKAGIKSSTQLSEVEKQILYFELDRFEIDAFTDKNSLFEYKEFLAIMSSGIIKKEKFPGFRMFSVDGEKDFQNYNVNQIKRALKDNHEMFERIERCIRSGNLETELTSQFCDSFIKKIEKNKNKDLDNWSDIFTYKEVLDAKEKKENRKENPLKIEDENISVYGERALNPFIPDENFFMRNEGSQTAKKRKKNILIFNSEKNSTVSIRVECNIRVKQNLIKSDDAKFTKDGKYLMFEFNQADIGFHKLEIQDETNKITYVLKICIIDILAEMFISKAIKTGFIVEYKGTKSKIKLLGIGPDLSFNINKSKINSQKLEDNKQYRCNYDGKLHLHATDDELSNYGDGISIDVNFAGVIVPFILFPDEAKSIEITGKNILRRKFEKKKSFLHIREQQLQMGTQEFYVKGTLLQELILEQMIIDKHILYGNCSHYLDEGNIKIEEQNILIDKTLEVAYLSLLDLYKTRETTPTLAYIDEGLRLAIERYITAFCNCYSTLESKQTLTPEQENSLLLGILTLDKKDDEIALTPFHPINLAYQLALCSEKGLDDAPDVIIDRLSSINLLPYIQKNRKVYKVSEQIASMEWKYYVPVENKKYMGSRKYVAKLIEEKVSEYVSHFNYIFDEINNKIIKINLINMGDCSEVFQGIAQYYKHVLSKQPDLERLLQFEMHIYGATRDNVFLHLQDYENLKKYLANDINVVLADGAAMNDLAGILSKNIDCYFHKDNGQKYAYAHITFYEMESEFTSATASMGQIETGISLDGLISGVPSSKFGQKYRTGFGTKHASHSKLVNLAALYNALIQVSDTSNPYQSGIGISTQVDDKAETKMNYVYDSSNWVVFIEPKVDLDFFCEEEAKNGLLIIHYSDQYTSSSGYDAITVTRKSLQYSKVIQEYLNEKGILAKGDDISCIINLFNAINGDWLLRLVSSKKMVGINKDTTFSREKISIVAAIKFMLAYLKHENILWVPISLEEMLRVSRGVGLSQNEGVLSAKNLGFEKGPTSDDLLFIGLYKNADDLKVFLYPTEVKTGDNNAGVIQKAFKQVAQTAIGLENAFNPIDEAIDTITAKVNRNFLIQLLITSCKKMKVYQVDDTQDWDKALDEYRQDLLNEHYTITNDIREVLGKGTVLSFKKGLASKKTSFKDDIINFIELPEQDEFGYILRDVQEIEDILLVENRDYKPLVDVNVSNLSGDVSNISITTFNFEVLDDNTEDNVLKQEANENFHQMMVAEKGEVLREQTHLEGDKGIKVLFGYNQQNGEEIYWEPNNTDKNFHTNTGIIGTMGTGKTQFTQSLIAQLYQNRKSNVLSDDIGILIFDYKGDYNEKKTDFIKLTNAKVYKPYHLPFNPLALTWSDTPKPLLPVHTANTFVDTLSKVYSNLGPKQKSILLNCIEAAYSSCGIRKALVDTWTNVPPTFATVYQLYANDEDIKKGDVLDAALQKISMFEIFEPVAEKTKSLFKLLQGVVVIDLSGYDSDIQNLVVAITLDLFYSQMQASGHSGLEKNMRQLDKFVLVDEADNFLREGYPSLRKILKEGREFGVGTILSTQFLKHFMTKEEDYSKYILTWVIHNVADLSQTDVRFVFNTSSGTAIENQLCSDIKSLKKHESIVKMGNSDGQVYMKDKAFWKYAKEKLED